jgi:hypothetical protein
MTLMAFGRAKKVKKILIIAKPLFHPFFAAVTR